MKNYQILEYMFLHNLEDDSEVYMEYPNDPRFLSQEGIDQYFENNRDFGFYDCESFIEPPILKCNHSWKATVLVTSTVYDCKKCGIKKEDIDSNRKL